MENILKASIGKIVFTDYLSFLLILASIASLVFMVGIPLLIIWIPLLIWRVYLIKKIIEQGKKIPGVLASKRFMRGEWIIWYVFEIGEKVYKVRNVVIAFKLPLDEKETITVAYDPENPQKAFLTRLYTN